jgi:hypothetical protein
MFQSSKAFAVLLIAMVLVPSVTFGRDRPGTPKSVQVTVISSTSIMVQAENTCDLTPGTFTGNTERCIFETDIKKDGLLPTADEKKAIDNQLGAGVVGGFGQHQVSNLTPGTTYCFRFWARRIDDGMRSAVPSAWVCGVTPLNAPLAPLDVRVRVSSLESNQPPRISWSTPDQSGFRSITRFTVERQSPPGANRPWIPEGQIAGPNGRPTNQTFTVTGSMVNLHAQHAYRVCAENSSGTPICASPVGISTAIDTFGGAALGGKQASSKVGMGAQLSPNILTSAKRNIGTFIQGRQATSPVIGAAPTGNGQNEEHPPMQPPAQQVQPPSRQEPAPAPGNNSSQSQNSNGWSNFVQTVQKNEAADRERCKNGPVISSVLGNASPGVSLHLRGSCFGKHPGTVRFNYRVAKQGGWLSGVEVPATQWRDTFLFVNVPQIPNNGDGLVDITVKSDFGLAVRTLPFSVGQKNAPVARMGSAKPQVQTQQPSAAVSVKTQLSPGISAVAKKSVSTAIQGGAAQTTPIAPPRTTASSGGAGAGSQTKNTSHLKKAFQQSGSWASVPGNNAALNPQPLPPQGTTPPTPNSQFSAPASALQR